MYLVASAVLLRVWQGLSVPGGWARLCKIVGNMAGGVFCCPAGLAALSVCLQISVQISFANCLGRRGR